MAKKRKPKTPSVPPSPPAITVDTPLTPEEIAFVNEWMIDRKNGLAYQRCHPDCLSHRAAREIGCRIRHQVNVDAEIRSRQREQAVRCQVSADQVITEIKRVAFSDILELFDPVTNNLRHPRHIPYDLRKAIASVKVSRSRRSVTRNGKTKTTVTDSFVEYKLWNKLDALAKLGNRLGLNTEITPVEALLQMLPRPLAVQVRAALLAPTAQAPSANGKALTESNGNGMH